MEGRYEHSYGAGGSCRGGSSDRPLPQAVPWTRCPPWPLKCHPASVPTHMLLWLLGHLGWGLSP